MIHLNKAIINIRTTQVDINTKQDEVIELITEGKFYQKSDAYYLVYDESEISGMQGTTTTLKIKDNQVVLRRLGSNSSTMEFEKNKRHRTQYKTPYGSMTMEMLTKSVDVYIKEEPLEIDITIEYDILIKNMFEGKNSMHITVNK
ncbi:MAG: hypothetical protein PWR23_1180 [Peptostreptococcaceae bacterium]|nr:hypothetical protein [Peptostreptococcaceae bacterium]